MKSLKILLFVVLLSVTAAAQVVWLPVNSKVYDFLENLSIKKIIDYHSEFKPISRKKAAQLLTEAGQKMDLLNEKERELLKWYKLEFGLELKSEQKRYYAYDYQDSSFAFQISPVLAYELNSYGGKSGYRRWFGVNSFATHSDWFGMSLDMRDHGEFGDNVDKAKKFTSQTGRETIGVSNGIEYSDVRAGMSVDFKWGSISFQKDYFTVGNGKFGQLIHSAKAPSYPFLRLELSPVPWLRFNYVHGFLNSDFIDSIGYYQRSNPVFQSDKQRFVKKYFVMNYLSFTPWDMVDFSIGNSAVYKGELKPEMFIPFAFYKYLDRDLGKGSIEDSNGQLFFETVLRYPERFKFYYTFFLDVTELRNVFKSEFWNTWFGITIGGKYVDAFVTGLDLSFEYSRITPWVYEHKDSTTTYKHINYDLGHWLGQNSDQFRIQADYAYSPVLYGSLYAESVRKGGLKDISFAYGDKTQEPFLYSPLRKEMRVGFEATWLYMHDLYARLKYEYSDISDEDAKRYPAFQLGQNHYISFIVGYNF